MEPPLPPPPPPLPELPVGVGLSVVVWITLVASLTVDVGSALNGADGVAEKVPEAEEESCRTTRWETSTKT